MTDRAKHVADLTVLSSGPQGGRAYSPESLGHLTLPLEIRVHGRGGQGGVTCAKLIAAAYAQLGLSVQTFGDYGAERSGAPIRAFTRVDRSAIRNRNKVYRPDHLLVLDTGLLGPALFEGVPPSVCLLINSSQDPEIFHARYPSYRLGVVDATGIAREHGIGTSAVVIINTTIVGGYARLMNLPMDAVEGGYRFFGFEDDLAAALAASKAVTIFEPQQTGESRGGEHEHAKPAGEGEHSGLAAGNAAPPEVLPIIAHTEDIPNVLKTGAWATQTPCYQDYAAPCSLACPAGNDVVGFIQALKEQDVDAAASLLLRTQPLPSVCGRVCPAPCMRGCNRDFYDGAVNIRGLERWIGDNNTLTLHPESGEQAANFAVLGGGPAGLSAAFHLAMRGQQVTVYEREEKLGGVLRTGIPGYRLPEQVLDADIERILALGVKTAKVRTVFASGPESDKTDNMTAIIEKLRQQHDGLLVCVGLGAPLQLHLDGEELPGVLQGLEYLWQCKLDQHPAEHQSAEDNAPEQATTGLSGTVVVIGGGNTAIDCARTALRSGATSVKLVYRRSRGEMPAIAEEIEDAVREGVQLLCHRQPVAFLPDGEGRLAGIVVAEVEQGEPDEDGRFHPLVTDRTVELACSTVLLALGQRKGVGLLPDDWRIEAGRAVDGAGPLNVWFAGDCLTGEGTVAHAIGSGRRMALTALASLASRITQADLSAADVGQGQAEKAYKSTVAPAHIRFSHFPVTPPHADRHRPPAVLNGNFQEVNLGLPGPGEAERCCSCGRCTHCDTCLVYCPDGIIYRKDGGYRIDLDYCKGCGICVAECPRRAMEMVDK